MNKAGTRDEGLGSRRGSVARDYDGVPMYRLCSGCRVEFYGSERYCPDCRQLGEQFDGQYLEMVAASEAAHAVSRFRQAARFVREWIWVPMFVFTAAALLYLAAVGVAAVWEWLQ